MRTRFYTEDELLGILIPRIMQFYSREQHLLRDDLCERSLVFRLGCILYNSFDGCSVHSEYNKFHDAYGAHSKSIPGQVHTYPDLIVFFDRIPINEPQNSLSLNQLFVEVKKSQNNRLQSDLNKLKWFTDDSYKLQYVLGCHLFLDVSCFIIVCHHHGYPYSVLKYEYDCIQNSCIGPQTQEVPTWFEYHSFSDLNRMFPRGARG